MKRISLLVTLAISLAATALLADSYETQIASMSQSLANSAIAAGRKRIAVMALTDLQGREKELGSFLAEALTDNLINIGLSNKAFTVVDREHLKVVLTKQKIAVTGIMNPETVKKLGLISGADAFIIGNITELQDEFSLFAKLIAAETAENLGSNRRKLIKTQELARLWGSSMDKAAIGDKPTNLEKPPSSEPVSIQPAEGGQPIIAKGIYEGKMVRFAYYPTTSSARMNIASVKGNSFKGEINFTDFHNAVLAFDGEVCKSFGDFTEQTRWQFAAKGKKFADGKWMKISMRKQLQGKDYNPNDTFYCSLVDGVLKGNQFLPEDPNPRGSIELRYSE